jgi:formylglycine-generating enzyme required for sulfatase activity
MPQTNGAEFDFFISYAKADHEWAEGVLTDALKAANFKCLTQADFVPGKPLLQSFEDAVTSSRQVVLVLSPEYQADNFTRLSDMLAQHYGTELGTWPVIPIIYKEMEDLPLRIRALNPLDATHREDWDAVIQSLIGQKPIPAPLIPPPPYRGLRTFSELDSAFFFGREKETEDAIHLLQTYPFLALIGPSGSGKSSLVYAGIIPMLKKSQSFGPGSWRILSMRPNDDPFQELSETLGGDPFQPQNIIAAKDNSTRLLLVVDQLEEIFTVSKGDTSKFQNALLELKKHENIFLVLTVRADFYPELMTSLLWPEIQRHRYEVTSLNEEGMINAIRKPAEKVGVYIEAALVERLARDAHKEPGVMPFVQETMILLWDKIVRRFLPLSAYEMLVLPRSTYAKRDSKGATGLEAAIALHAEKVLGRLDEKEQIIARRIFIRLVHFGEGRPDTRRQQAQSALRANEDPLLFRDTLLYLADEKSRLLSLSGEEKGTSKVDISHEALLTVPSLIRDWIEQGRADELHRRDLEDDAQKWIEEKRNPSYLYVSNRLQEAQEWSARFHQEIDSKIQDFLKVSAKYNRRRQLERYSFFILLGLFALFGLGSSVYFIEEETAKQIARGPMVEFASGPAILGYGKTRVVRDLPAFSLDKYEVTNRQYGLCVDAGRCTISYNPYYEGGPQPADNMPVTSISAFQAADFCDWIGRRLPTAMEWERAVRGTTGRTWPWGEESPVDPKPRVHIFLPEWPQAVGLDGPVAVDDKDFADGATPEGVWQLLGNAAEWTSTFATVTTCPDPYGEDCQVWDGKTNKVQALYIVGLGWSDDLLSEQKDRVSEYYPASPTLNSGPSIGFRCAK